MNNRATLRALQNVHMKPLMKTLNGRDGRETDSRVRILGGVIQIYLLCWFSNVKKVETATTPLNQANFKQLVCI